MSNDKPTLPMSVESGKIEGSPSNENNLLPCARFFATLENNFHEMYWSKKRYYELESLPESPQVTTHTGIAKSFSPKLDKIHVVRGETSSLGDGKAFARYAQKYNQGSEHAVGELIRKRDFKKAEPRVKRPEPKVLNLSNNELQNILGISLPNCGVLDTTFFKINQDITTFNETTKPETSTLSPIIKDFERLPDLPTSSFIVHSQAKENALFQEEKGNTWVWSSLHKASVKKDERP